LLSLQEHDTRIDQLEHRRVSLPERAELTETEHSLAQLEGEASAVQSKLDAVGRDQRRREDEVVSIEAKIKEINDSMYSGGVTSPRELQTMQEEIEALRRRLGAIEDEIIELMEYAEPLNADLVTFGERRDGLDDAARVALAKIAEQEAVIDVDLGEVQAERDELAATIPVEVVEMYEGMRKSFAGVAVARLEHGTCGGCFLALPSAELDRIRHLAPDAIVHCEECGRLLVH
jgi:uncharacterized protein